MSERAKPFVAHLSQDAIEAAHRGDATYYNLHLNQSPLHEKYLLPVVVTPLLPDDPRPGETWEYRGASRKQYVIAGAPYKTDGHVRVPVDPGWSGAYGADPGWSIPLADLCRPPALKTFRIREGVALTVEPCRAAEYRVEATSREEAIAKLADALEEVAK